MKNLVLLLMVVLCMNTNAYIQAQSESQLKLDNLKYYLSSVKDNVLYMRYNTDSVNILNILDQMDILTSNLEAELDKIIVPQEEIPQTTFETTEEVEDTNTTTEQVYTDMEQTETTGQDGLGLSKFMPFKKKFNTALKIETGINSIFNNNEIEGVLYPEINTGGSWYWDISLIRSARLGGKNSKVAINYGLSYLKSRFKLDNDLLLTTDAKGNPAFIVLENAKSNPKINISYLNIPLSITFALSKKSKLELGGYFGYRVNTVQKNHFKTDNVNIHEQRYARHELNNWLYGGKVSVNFSGFNLIGRYNFSKLFNDNHNYDLSTFMIGTSLSLF